MNQTVQAKENILRERIKRHAKEENKQALWTKNRQDKAKRTNQEQLAQLDFRLGKNIGAKRERKRLNGL